jgi:hypothetical protein
MKFEGKNGDYFWIEWKEPFLSDLLSAFPNLVIGKYLVNTSFDSGSLTLSQEELNQGWNKFNELTLSPSIKNSVDLPFCHYDEWYVFNSPTKFENYEVFVNYLGFSLQDFPKEIKERFWQQIDRLSPETFFAEGDYLVCVTKDASLFKQVSLWQEVEHT